jgi:capsular exopolysaccharide synthesis family protein
MERIKQALEKAKAERDGGNPTPARAAAMPLPSEGAPITETTIQYSQTRVAALDPRHLRAMHVIFGDADRAGLTAYKMLRTQVLQRMTARGWNALAVTSPRSGDGKTLTAVNLALSLARELNQTVLLADMDLRNPCVHRYFGLNPLRGIGDYLMGSAPMSEVLVNPSIERLVLLPGREPLENSSEILSSPAMGGLVQELKSRYPSRMVVFDLPPVLAADDALGFAPYVDAFLLVLREGKNTREDLEHAMEIMKDSPIIGTVLNASGEKISPYY